MSEHLNHEMHSNSLETYEREKPRLGKRQGIVYDLIVERRIPITARECCVALGFKDMNAVRPRLHELKKLGLIEECGKVLDRVTRQRVALFKVRLKPEKQESLF